MPIQIDESRLSDKEYRQWLKSWNVTIPGEEVEEEEDPTQQPKPIKPDQSVNPNAPSTQTLPEAKRVDTNYDSWTVEELRDKLGEMELSKAGNKEQMVDRIRKAEA